MDQQLRRFINRLANLPATPNAFNPWGRADSHNAIRRKNLELYFLEVAERKPKYLLLGEAPGYQGCRLSGIPFMSEDIVLRGIPELDMFGRAKGYRKTTEFERIHKEPSATIVWSAFSQHSFVPLLWASFPFHPHQPGHPRSNRAPTKTEVELGQKIFQELAEIFRIKTIVAVGNVAHQSLSAIGISADKIRHPSHGGKNDFVRGIQRLKK